MARWGSFPAAKVEREGTICALCIRMNTQPSPALVRVRRVLRLASPLTVSSLVLVAAADRAHGRPARPGPDDVPPQCAKSRPDLTEEIRLTRNGIGPIKFKGYHQPDTRLPMWFVVKIDRNQKATVDLYDAGVQGRIHAVLVRPVKGRNLKLFVDDVQQTVPATADGFYRLPGSGWVQGSLPEYREHPAVITFDSATCVLECVYADFADFPPATAKQPGDGSPPPTRPGMEH